MGMGGLGDTETRRHGDAGMGRLGDTEMGGLWFIFSDKIIPRTYAKSTSNIVIATNNTGWKPVPQRKQSQTPTFHE